VTAMTNPDNSRENDTVEVFQSKIDGQWRWRRQAANGEIIAVPGEGYANKDHAFAMALSINGIEPVYASDEH